MAWLTACGGASGGLGTPGSYSSAGTPGSAASGGPTGSTGTGTGASAGTLTAGAWDDNLNFDYFRAYLGQTGSLSGRLELDRSDRLMVTVTGGKLPSSGAEVSLSRAGKVLARSRTGADGRVVFFPASVGAQKGEELLLRADAFGSSEQVDSIVRAGDASAALTLAEPAKAIIGVDVAVVLDTTGSMGDEITWVKAELATATSLSASIAAAYPGVAQRWALVLYRDVGDTYVTKVFDFGSIEDFGRNAASAQAGGGGDFPEAVAAALAEAAKLSWRPGNVARVAVHFADAPHHQGQQQQVAAALEQLRVPGVHYYPVASSGADELFENTFRSIAQATLGRYLFLTDDSGVGNTHKEPTLPCYLVTRLNVAVLRMVSMEITGLRLEPTPEQILRRAGDPKDGRCTLADGTILQAL